MFSYQQFLLYVSIVTLTQSTELNLIYLGEYRNHQVEDVSLDQVNLQVYYESLCPYSQQFFTGPLDKLLKEMGSYINLTMYPYGNAIMENKDGKTVVECQHGKLECYGNKLHACAIDVLELPILSEFYISCLMSAKWGGTGSTDMDAVKCGESMFIDARPITECAKSERGDVLLEYYGSESEMVGFRSVPYVLINSVQFQAEDDLKTKVCEAFNVIVAPPPCHNYYHS